MNKKQENKTFAEMPLLVNQLPCYTEELGRKGKQQ